MLFSALLTIVVSCACLGRMTDAVNPELQDMKTHMESTKIQSMFEKRLTTLESRSEESQSSTLKQVQDMKTQLESTKTQLESTKTQLQSTNTQLESTKIQLESTKSQLELRIEELMLLQMEMDAKFTAVDEKLDECNNKHYALDMARNSPIAFAARATADIIYPPAATVIFQGVTLNSGDAYNSETGIFTCPLEGIYFFTASTYSNSGHTPGGDPSAYIMRDDEALVGLRDWPEDTEVIMMSNSVVMSCAAQQQVSVRAYEDLEVRDTVYTSAFSGFYIGS